ncbi:MAG: hypothetical protein WAM80_15650, partial [Candidatus Acidiferrales bacterium]
MKNSYNGVEVPKDGAAIEYGEGVSQGKTRPFAQNETDGAPAGSTTGTFRVPERPIIPFIEGDGTGRDIWRASRRVFDAAVERAYGGKRKVAWLEVFAGEKAFRNFKEWLPQDTV